MTRSSSRSVWRHVAFASLLCSSACLPYALGSTAQTVAPQQTRTTATLWFMPNGIALRDSANSDGHTIPGVDAEVRLGINDHADFGIRVPSASGIVLSYRRRVAGAPHPDSAAISWQIGGGVVNLGEHALIEAGLLASGPTRDGVTWYGAARILQVAPLSSGAVHDQPSIGATIGAEIRVGDGGVLPELSIYHDPSALGIRRSQFIFVPAVSLRGSWLYTFLKIVRLLGSIPF